VKEGPKTGIKPSRKWRIRRNWKGCWESSLSSGVFSGTPFHRFTHPRSNARRTVCAEVSTLFSTFRIPRLRAQGCLRTINNVQKVSNTRCTPCSGRDGRSDVPLCADLPLPTGITEGYPVSIQSFTLFFRERRSNNAQKDLRTITPLGELGAVCASFPILFSG